MAEQLLGRPARHVERAREPVRSATFPRQMQVAPQARRFVTKVIGPHPVASDVELLAGELVANSLLHAHDATTVAVAIAVTEDCVCVDVYDDGRTGIPHWREADDRAEGGRGFQLVNLLASAGALSASKSGHAAGSK
jgi:anti-sigma regulatory factor (Ser/Thr protein kinase)